MSPYRVPSTKSRRVSLGSCVHFLNCLFVPSGLTLVLLAWYVYCIVSSVYSWTCSLSFCWQRPLQASTASRYLWHGSSNQLVAVTVHVSLRRIWPSYFRTHQWHKRGCLSICSAADESTGLPSPAFLVCCAVLCRVSSVSVRQAIIAGDVSCIRRRYIALKIGRRHSVQLDKTVGKEYN